MAVTSALRAETLHGASAPDTMLPAKLDMSMPTIVSSSIPEQTITFKPLMLTSTPIGATSFKFSFHPNRSPRRALSVLEIRYLPGWLNAATFSACLVLSDSCILVTTFIILRRRSHDQRAARCVVIVSISQRPDLSVSTRDKKVNR